MLKAIFWDMDGTLVDSEPLWGVATYELSEEVGRRLTPELREKTVGGNFDNTLRICASHAGVELAELDYDGLRERMYTRVSELFAHQLEPVPGMVELLSECARRNVAMAITTNTPRQLAHHAVTAVGEHFFDTAFFGDQVPQPKPAPDMYQLAAQHFGLDPHECLVFEDSITGMQAATAAGCRVIGVVADPHTPTPDRVRTLGELHGSIDFSTITADMVEQWFEQLP
ncbi:Phosphorylated carbohydrates phosphatase [Corynebacterium ciconiae DSM 44920]|uniref:HAD family hydrolase n=1 Tax=Corynebacterium ciconiae TaxID=227319 RepID=UPI00035EE230|nr:HAD family phosphatase [Corynebacterium ciconiae]WKD61195.1 Phosphorylated carbohydrates phosphatase [Corynebacterium ciconiae DSM 44920]